MKLDSIIAKLCGLWLAEGDNFTNYEVTFTNNNEDLILFFHSNITKILDFKNQPRIYVYSPDKKEKPILSLNLLHKYYVDKRASKPYFIYRIADVNAVKEWKKIVNSAKNKKKFYPFLLQGLFAGEGSIKFHLKSKSRTLRISQGHPNPLIETILTYLGVTFDYDEAKRNYEITGRNNLEKLKLLNISVMHNTKHKKFLNMLNSYKQYHYSKNYLKNVFRLLMLSMYYNSFQNEMFLEFLMHSKIHQALHQPCRFRLGQHCALPC
jgi:hypothetical protein